jgi:hypothetical protein
MNYPLLALKGWVSIAWPQTLAPWRGINGFAPLRVAKWLLIFLAILIL